MSRLRLRGGIVFLGLTLLAAANTPASARPIPRPPVADTLTADQVAFTLRYRAAMPPAQGGDRWFSRDKAKHVVFSALWTLSTQYVLVNKVGWANHRALPASIGSGVAIGVTKEIYDAQVPGRTASTKDFVADVVGIGLAAGIIVL